MLNSESSETNNETNQRSAALKQIAETIEEEEEEPYPTETGGHRHRFDSNHQQQHNSDSNQDLHQLTPTSTKSILQQAAADRENNENHKKMHHDDDNILNGKSSTYYNDIRNKGSEMVSRTDSRRSRTAAAKENHRLTKLDFDQNQGKSLRRTTYQDENGGGGDGDEDDENNNVVLSEQSEIHFFNKLKFYRVPNGEGQITENFDYDQDPRVFYTTGARYKRNSNGSFGAGGSLKRLNPISENDEMNDQLLDPVTAAERFYKGENLWVPAVQGPINPKSKDEIILMKEGSSENLISEEEEDGTKKKKKNLKVKIKLPTDNFPKLKPKKQRHLQKCCLVLFLLTLFVIVTGILLYFFVWGYVQTKN